MSLQVNGEGGEGGTTKKKKRKKKKKSGGGGGNTGDGTGSGVANTDVANAGVANTGNAGGSKKKLKQTDPPTVPIVDLFPDG